MSAADRPAESAATASDVAAACRDAEFVRLVASADGDALAATGVLARALDATGRAFQASVVPGLADTTRKTDADATIAIGRSEPTADHTLATGTEPVSEMAFVAAEELGSGADPLLALAGASVAPSEPSGRLREAAERAGATRRPGVGVPTANLADGLAHSTRVHTPVSGDRDAAREALVDIGLPAAADPEAAELQEADHRRVASMVAIRTVAAEAATARAAERVEDVLRPHAIDGPFGTVEGYGDVLDAVAREQPGTGIALALGHDVAAPALDAWQTHGERAHRALRAATTGRYDGAFVARGETADLGVDSVVDVPVETVARLLRDFRSPEPVALFVTDGRAAASAVDRDVTAPMREAATETGGSAAATSHGAVATVESDTAEFIMAFREAL